MLAALSAGRFLRTSNSWRRRWEFSGYQPLIRAYIGQGLRKDLARLVESDQVKMKVVVESLRRDGIDEQVIAEAIAEARGKSA